MLNNKNLVIVFNLIQVTHLFNFDLKHPILIKDVFDKVGSSFGASVALVAQDVSGKAWIIVGAPKAESPNANYSGIKEPGLVWRCSLDFEHENGTHCSILQLDRQGEMDIKMSQVPKEVIHRDRKNHAMLGAAMAMGSGASNRFVVCSSRWANQKYKEHHLMNGICYWIPKSFIASHNSSSLDFSHRLLPLVNSSRQASVLMVASNGKQMERRFDWAYGQAGFSAHISPKNELLLGAPGIMEWAGSVIQYKDYDPIRLNNPYLRFNQKDSTFAQVLIPRSLPLIERNVIGYFDYFGYAITSGNFFRLQSNQTQYAGGAPRGGSLGGKVLLFSFAADDENYASFNRAVPDSLHFLTDPLVGESADYFGSYFGSCLAALDVNGDGLDDLLVGAPLYGKSYSSPIALHDSLTSSSSTNILSNPETDEDQSKLPMSSGDEGCVFVYISLGEDFDRFRVQDICGDSSPKARFGTTMTRLGDINFDGFQDVAIGAPFESEGRGAVYIYIGSFQGLALSQKLFPEVFDPSIRGFGLSLHGEVDIDQNTYPDLAVGAFASNHALVFRTRTVVEIKGTLSTNVEQISSETGVFSITACLKYSGHSIAKSLGIWAKLSLDSEVKRTRIVEFVPDSRILTDNFSKHSISFVGFYRRFLENCFKFNVTTVGDLDISTLPLTVRLEAWIDGTNSPSMVLSSTNVSCISYQITNDTDGNPVVLGTATNFGLLRRAMPPIQQSTASKSLAILAIPILTICEEDGDPSCIADLKINASFRFPDGRLLLNDDFIIGLTHSLTLRVELSNHRERANLPLTLEIIWDGSIPVRSSKSDCNVDRNIIGTNENVVHCSLQIPLNKNKKESIELELDMSKLYVGSGIDEVVFKIVANTSSLVEVPAFYEKRLKFSYESNVVLTTHAAEASYYENITSETVNFTQIYEVGLDGVSPIVGIQLQVGFPSDVFINGELLPLLRIREPITTYNGQRMNCYSLNESFFGETKIESDLEIFRSKREVSAQTSPKKRAASIFLEQSFTVSCQSPGVSCFFIECEALAFQPSHRATVEFRLRLVTKTAKILFDEKDREVMLIESLGRVGRLGSITEFNFAVSKTLIRAELPIELKAWVLIVSIGAGVIIFVLISMLLMRCGFFRRAKMEELAKFKKGKGAGYLFEHELVGSMEYFDGATFEDPSFSYGSDRYQQLPRMRLSPDEIYDELDLCD